MSKIRKRRYQRRWWSWVCHCDRLAGGGIHNAYAPGFWRSHGWEPPYPRRGWK